MCRAAFMQPPCGRVAFVQPPEQPCHPHTHLAPPPPLGDDDLANVRASSSAESVLFPCPRSSLFRLPGRILRPPKQHGDEMFGNVPVPISHKTRMHTPSPRAPHRVNLQIASALLSCQNLSLLHCLGVNHNVLPGCSSQIIALL